MKKKPNDTQVSETIMKNLSFIKTESNELMAFDENNPQRGAFDIAEVALRDMVFDTIGGPPNKIFMDNVVQRIRRKAKDVAKKRAVFRRVARTKRGVCVDLKGKYLIITKDKAKIQEKAPVCFIQADTMLSLPKPDLSTDIDPKDVRKEFRKLLNLTPNNEEIALAWCMGPFRGPRGASPVLLLEGPQGSGKSKAANNLASIVDPHTGLICSLPTNEKDLFILARNRQFVFFDNISEIKDVISDRLCRMASGASIVYRKLYTDADCFTVTAHPTIALNGITIGAARPDLLDRALRVETHRIPDKKKLSEAALDRRFKEFHPRLLGAMARAIQYALRHPKELPADLKSTRLIDFAEWTYSWAPAFGYDPRELVESIIKNQKNLKLNLLNTDSVAMIVIELLENHGGAWKGTSTALYDEYMRLAEDKKLSFRGRLDSPAALTRWLERAKPIFEEDGVSVTRGRTGNNRWISIKKDK